MNPDKVISEAVQSIQAVENSRKKAVEKLFPLKNSRVNGFLEEQLVFPVKKAELGCSVAGVDSGFCGKSLFSLDLVFVRAAGVVFSYKGSMLKKADYFPSTFSFPKPIFISNALQRDEFNVSQSLLRLLEEVSLAKEMIEKFGPEYCLLDGSIVPQHADKPRKDSKVNASYYSKVISAFEELFDAAEKNNSILLGCIEDSRGSRFRELLQESGSAANTADLNDCFDSVLLDYLLKEGERTSCFTYTGNTKQHPILNDFTEKYSSKVNAVYLKPSAYDRPLRVEFLQETGNTKKLTEFASNISSVILALTSFHREYAFPSVLIEADLRAKLNQNDIDLIHNKILDKLGRNFRTKLRRDSRPF